MDLRPREHGDEGDADDEGVLDAEGHEERGNDTTTEDGDPELL